MGLWNILQQVNIKLSMYSAQEIRVEVKNNQHLNIKSPTLPKVNWGFG